MASKSLQSFGRSLKALRSSFKDPLTQCLIPRLSRSMATQTELPSSTLSISNSIPPSKVITAATTKTLHHPVLTTIYKFPSMEPTCFKSYPANLLHLPLRRDLLHRAVIFEGDRTRQGTASTKNRWEIHGSHKKLIPQKGTGRARVGTRQSPMRVGGSKAHGPRPRDFSTDLPRKMYDLAWRTALSYRYRKGDLIICANGMDIERPHPEFAEQIFLNNGWGKVDGRSLIITTTERKNLFEAMEKIGSHGRVKTVEDVDVKNLLESGRLIVERSALEVILSKHRSDLTG